MQQALRPANSECRAKLEQLRAALVEGEADVNASRVFTLQNESEIEAFFASL
jgi:hypothetical protein